MSETIRLTVAQATVEFLAVQWTERDGERQRLFAGCFGIFGHGNVAGIGQALLQHETKALDAGRRPALATHARRARPSR
jgi:3D-(3,5/4)-trihydroxycyclohexane-1,2-dione acylhydrolase (decyclizing)